MNVDILHLKGKFGAGSESRFTRYTHCIRLVVPFNERNCHLTHSAMPEIIEISVFKSMFEFNKNNFTTMKHGLQ